MNAAVWREMFTKAPPPPALPSQIWFSARGGSSPLSKAKHRLQPKRTGPAPDQLLDQRTR